MFKRIDYNSPVTLTFTFICCIVYMTNRLTGDLIIPHVSLNTDIGYNYHTIISYIFGHANFEHIVGNITFILLLGPALEEKHGSKNLLILILITALITGVINLILFNTGIIGASGIVFMFIVLISFTKTEKGKVPLTFILVLLLFVGTEIINSFKIDNISQFAHILGGMCGSVFWIYETFSEKRDY